MSYEEWYDKYIKNNPEQLKYIKMNKYRSKDMKQYYLYKNVLGNKNIPKNFDLFQKLKYNDIDKWELTKREFKTINSIKNKNWTDVFKSNAIDTYYKFREENIEVSDHFLSRFLNSGRNSFGLTIEDIKTFLNNSINYIEHKTDGNYNNIRYIRYKNSFIRLISNKNDSELKSIVFDKNNQEKQKLIMGVWNKYED